MSLKKLRDQVDFCLQTSVSYKLVLLPLVGLARHAQSTQNNKLAISSQNKVRDKYDFLHEDKYQSFLQASSIVFTGHSQACPKFPN